MIGHRITDIAAQHGQNIRLAEHIKRIGALIRRNFPAEKAPANSHAAADVKSGLTIAGAGSRGIISPACDPDFRTAGGGRQLIGDGQGRTQFRDRVGPTRARLLRARRSVLIDKKQLIGAGAIRQNCNESSDDKKPD